MFRKERIIPPHERLANVLRKIHASAMVGNYESIISDCTEVFYGRSQSMRNRAQLEWVPDYNIVMQELFEACYRIRDCHEFRNGLSGFRNMFSSIKPGAIRDIYSYILKRLAQIGKQAEKDLDVSPSSIDITNHSTELVWYASRPTDLTFDAICRLRFCWDCYRTLLETLKAAAGLESSYSDAVEAIYGFSAEYGRSDDVHAVTELIHMHMKALREREVNTLPFIHIRAVAIKHSLRFKLWNDVFLLCQDIHTLTDFEDVTADYVRLYYLALSHLFVEAKEYFLAVIANLQYFRSCMIANVETEELRLTANRIIALFLLLRPYASNNSDNYDELKILLHWNHQRAVTFADLHRLILDEGVLRIASEECVRVWRHFLDGKKVNAEAFEAAEGILVEGCIEQREADLLWINYVRTIVVVAVAGAEKLTMTFEELQDLLGAFAERIESLQRLILSLADADTGLVVDLRGKKVTMHLPSRALSFVPRPICVRVQPAKNFASLLSSVSETESAAIEGHADHAAALREEIQEFEEAQKERMEEEKRAAEEAAREEEKRRRIEMEQQMKRQAEEKRRLEEGRERAHEIVSQWTAKGTRELAEYVDRKINYDRLARTFLVSPDSVARDAVLRAVQNAIDSFCSSEQHRRDAFMDEMYTDIDYRHRVLYSMEYDYINKNFEEIIEESRKEYDEHYEAELAAYQNSWETNRNLCNLLDTYHDEVNKVRQFVDKQRQAVYEAEMEEYNAELERRREIAQKEAEEKRKAEEARRKAEREAERESMIAEFKEFDAKIIRAGGAKKEFNFVQLQRYRFLCKQLDKACRFPLSYQLNADIYNNKTKTTKNF